MKTLVLWSADISAKTLEAEEFLTIQETAVKTAAQLMDLDEVCRRNRTIKRFIRAHKEGFAVTRLVAGGKTYVAKNDEDRRMLTKAFCMEDEDLKNRFLLENKKQA